MHARLRPVPSRSARGLFACLILLLLVAVVMPASAVRAAGVISSDRTALTGVTVHDGAGRVIENAVVLVADGEIVAVGPDVAVPEDAEVIDGSGMHVTPGLIDANALVEPADLVSDRTPRATTPTSPLAALFDDGRVTHVPGCRGVGTAGLPCACDGNPICALASAHSEMDPDAVCPVCGQAADPTVAFVSGVMANRSRVESSSEVVPYTYVLDDVNFRSPDWHRLVRDGVTTVFVAPDAAAVIGPRGAIVHTAGPVRDRVIREAADVQATMGVDSFRVGGGNLPPFRGYVTARTRRPNSRMGVAWVFRKAFHDTLTARRGLEPPGVDVPSPEAMEVLGEILDGEVPLRIQARTETDIATALRLAAEFGLDFILLEAHEAHEALEAIRSTGVPVIYGPIEASPRAGGRISYDGPQINFSTLPALVDAGIETALSARDLREENGLARQAMYAVKAGLSHEQALAAVTSIPARLLGIDDRVGTVEPGKQADLVLWNGAPFAAASRAEIVLVRGRIVSDRRSGD